MSCVTLCSRQVQYITNPKQLHVTWQGFHDPESGISDFYLQVFQGDSCKSGEIGDDHVYEPLSSVRDVKNITEITFFEYLFEEGWYCTVTYKQPCDFHLVSIEMFLEICYNF